eukprot:scaffold126967_cov18-Tisochrysis_lutea.AAC.1
MYMCAITRTCRPFASFQVLCGISAKCCVVSPPHSDVPCAQASCALCVHRHVVRGRVLCRSSSMFEPDPDDCQHNSTVVVCFPLTHSSCRNVACGFWTGPNVTFQLRRDCHVKL